MLQELTSFDSHYNLSYMLKIFMLCLLTLSAVSYAGDDCLDWFRDSGVLPNSKDCPIKCNLIDMDMNTFMCPNRCDEFCKPAPKCKPDPFWLKQIRSGRPEGWPNDSEMSAPWTTGDREILASALGQLPGDFKTKNLKGIFRMKKSIEIINPGTTTDGAIALYDRAFGGPFSLGRVVAHELAHLYYSAMKQDQQRGYLNLAGWEFQGRGRPMKPNEDRQFVNKDAMSSPEEDFAHNVDTYLFEPNRLKSLSPKIFKWVENHFSKKFSLKTECKDGK